MYVSNALITHLPVMVKTPTARLIPLLPSKVTSVRSAWLLFCTRLDFMEAQMPVASTSR